MKLDYTDIKTILDNDFLWQQCLELLKGVSPLESNEAVRGNYGDESDFYISHRREMITPPNPNKILVLDGTKFDRDAHTDIYVVDCYAVRRYLSSVYPVVRKSDNPGKDLMSLVKDAIETTITDY